MKKSICILMCLSMLLCFFGCAKSIQNVPTATTTATASSSVEKVSESTATTKKKTTTAEKSTTPSAIAEESTARKSTTAKATSGKNATKKTTTRKTTEKSVTAEITTVKKTTTSAYITCSAVVECRSILDNMDDLKAGHESYVPSDGIILSTSGIKVKNGSTAYDAVRLACENSGVSLNTVSSGYGRYIAGFNNIDERDCGRDSGWKYKVNGIYPSKSCDKYVLKDGDRIEFTYVCNYN